MYNVKYFIIAKRFQLALPAFSSTEKKQLYQIYPCTSYRTLNYVVVDTFICDNALVVQITAGVALKFQ